MCVLPISNSYDHDNDVIKFIIIYILYIHVYGMIKNKSTLIITQIQILFVMNHASSYHY